MAVTVELPVHLRSLAGTKQVEVEGKRVVDALRAIDEMHPGLSDQVLNEQDEPRPHILIFLNDVEIRSLSGTKTILKGNEEILIVPAVSGGETWRKNT